MDPNQTFRMQAIKEHVHSIPKEKWAAKIQRGVIALVLLGAVVAEVRFVRLGIPWWVLVGMLFLAGIMFSPDLWKAPLKIFVGALKDIIAVVRNKNGG